MGGFLNHHSIIISTTMEFTTTEKEQCKVI